MRLADFLFCTDCPRERFNALRRHGNLPFPADEDAKGSGWQQFSLEDAFEFRLMLDLMGDDGERGPGWPGILPSQAVRVVSNAIAEARAQWPRHPLDQIEPTFWWLGVVIFESRDEADDCLRFARSYAGEIEGLWPWIAARQNRENAEAVRVYVANMATVAERVRSRAAEIPLSAEHRREALR